jgi:hypothetical protein
MAKQTIHPGPSQERRTLGLRWGAVRRLPPTSRNDHIHLFSTENNARRLREAIRQADEGRLTPTTVEELAARYGLGEL